MPAVRQAPKPWPLLPWRSPSMVGERSFRFLNVERTLTGAEGWNALTNDKLWLYNLHYFDDLTAEQFALRRDWHANLISDWIDQNPPVQGNGWEPYPIALRLVNWVVWDLASGQLSASARASLSIQARALRNRLEYHLLGNHLWANAKALVFAGVYFSGGEAEEWRTKGLALLERELQEQVLEDGGHFELSPMYHSIILNDLIELVALADCHPGTIDPTTVERWRREVGRMACWLRVMSHPDGDIAAFNDSALAIAPRFEQILPRMRAIGVGEPNQANGRLCLLQASGYARMCSREAVVFVDIGRIGPDYLPGHAHADTLSMELSVAGHRLVVDPGTSLYHVCPERLRQRGTGAHNSVVVDRHDSSEVWSSFRVARRAHPRDIRSGEVGESVWVSAAHDGYMHLPGKVIHTRRWDLAKDELVIRDRLDGVYGTAEGGFLIHPDWLAREAGDTIVLERADKSVMVHAVNASLALRESRWSPTFGDDHATTRIVVSPRGSAWETRFSWA